MCREIIWRKSSLIIILRPKSKIMNMKKVGIFIFTVIAFLTASAVCYAQDGSAEIPDLSSRIKDTHSNCNTATLTLQMVSTGSLEYL